MDEGVINGIAFDHTMSIDSPTDYRVCFDAAGHSRRDSKYERA
jgi:hypothetical protein